MTNDGDALPPVHAARPLARAVSGLLLLGLAWSVAIGAPPPSFYGVPHTVHDPVLTCAAVQELASRGRSHERSSSAIVHGHLEPSARPDFVRVVCREGGAHPGARWMRRSAIALGICGLLISLADVVFASALGTIVLLAAVALALAVPRQGARKSEAHLTLSELSELELAPDESHRTALRLRGRTLGWLPAASSSALAAIVHREIERLVSHARTHPINPENEG